MDNFGKFIGEIEKIPYLKQLYQACDYAFNGAMYLAGKIHPNFENFLREHQGLIALGFGFGASYFSVMGSEEIIKNYPKIISYIENTGYVINILIPILIEFFNPRGLQGLAKDHPTFSCGLVGLVGGSTIAAMS